MATRFDQLSRVVFGTVPLKCGLWCSWRELGIGDQCQQAASAEEGGRMAAHKALPIELSSAHECELTALARAHSTPQKLAERARIVLLAATGLGVGETAQRLGIWRKTAGHWRRRWRHAA